MNFPTRSTERLEPARFRATYAVGLAALLAASCGSAAVPNAQFAETRASVGAAQATGAQEIPEASLYLKMATDGVALAETQMEQDEDEAAAETLQRAMADAELAKSLADTAKAKAESDLALERIENLRHDQAPQG